MRFASGILGLVCLAVVAVKADEPAGAMPLESTKQELKKLRTEQAASASGSAVLGKITDGLTHYRTPLPEPLQPGLPRPEDMEREMKQRSEAQKNWLVDGVDNLDKAPETRSRPKDDRGGAQKSELDEKEVDRHDPNYLLKLYTAQQRADAAKSGQAKSSTGQTDPFAPFLQNWLGSSPARGKFFDEFVRKPGANGAVVTSTGSTEPDGRQSLGAVDLGLSTPVAKQANPYLQGLDSTARLDSTGSRNQSNVAGTGLGNTGSQRTSDGQPSSVAVERPAEKKPQWLAPSDDKKYYPQLKKF